MSLETQILCPICLCPIKECCVTPCGHAFCKKCIDEAWNFHEAGPYCNAIMKANQYYRFYQFDQIVNSIQNSPLKSTTMVEEKKERVNETIPKDNKQMVTVKTIINNTTTSEKNVVLQLPYDLNELVKVEDAMEGSTVTLSSQSTTFPFTQTEPIPSYSLVISAVVKERKFCLRYRFVKGMRESFYRCKTCNVRFICSTCAEVCHHGHDIEKEMEMTCANAVCYCCKSPNQECQLTLK